MSKIYVFKILILFLFITSCTNSSSKENKSSNFKKSNISEYDIINLENELKEISGITFITDSLIAAVEDENGILYFIDLKTEKIVRKLKFSEPDDFEDLIRVGEDIYTVNSKGDIFHIKSFSEEEPEITKFKTDFTKKNDIESLTYLKKDNVLLLGVKSKSLVGDKEDKSIYSFSLATKKLNTLPYLNINNKDLENLFKGDKLEETSKEFLKKLGNENLNKVFTPTALAFHPQTKELYVLSSVNNLILVFKDKKIVRSISFRGREFSQAEGMSFNSKGVLYLSNEGKKNPGNIIKINKINDN